MDLRKKSIKECKLHTNGLRFIYQKNIYLSIF